MAEDRLGAVRIAPQVLTTIAQLTTLAVPGVVEMHRDIPGGFDRWLKGQGNREGVRMAMVDDAVAVDVYVVADKNVNLYALGQEIQTAVARAIQDIVGIPVLSVTVHIEDVRIATPAE
ncbi:MAG: Asp23/Gls24 family envelope stress response protein [Chloroflexota bacterium]